MLKFKGDKVTVAVILCSLYFFFSLASNIASTKLIRIGGLVTDAGILYYLLFTWRDLIHQRLGKRIAILCIWLATLLNVLAAAYFWLVGMLPSDPSWAAAGGSSAWAFIFSLQLRIVIGSILAFLVSEFIDTWVYAWWVAKYAHYPLWTRVAASNLISVPIDTFLFLAIAFYGVVPLATFFSLFLTNILLKILFTFASMWLIYLISEKKVKAEKIGSVD